MLRRFTFQSTLPHGSDPRRTPHTSANLIISIHAPSRERPSVNHFFIVFFWYFNPRSLTGATAVPQEARLCYINFNPRSLTGATYGIPAYGYAGNDFNPRSLTGATQLLRLNLFRMADFNPRSLTGATSCCLFCKRSHCLFQSTLPHGSDLICKAKESRYWTFQSTLPHGSDPPPTLTNSRDTLNFNPRSLTGATCGIM